MAFFLRFTAPCGIVILLLLGWAFYLVFWPTFVADSMYGSDKAFSTVMKCGDWKPEDDQKVRDCTLETATHHFVFVQWAVTNPDGNTVIVPRNVHSELKVWTAILLTVSVSLVIALVWVVWCKTISFLFRADKERGVLTVKTE